MEGLRLVIDTSSNLIDLATQREALSELHKVPYPHQLLDGTEIVTIQGIGMQCFEELISRLLQGIEVQDLPKVGAHSTRKARVVDLEVYLLLETHSLQSFELSQEGLKGCRRRLVYGLRLLHIFHTALILIDEEQDKSDKDRYIGDPARPNEDQDIL